MTLTPEIKLELLRKMLRARLFEEKIVAVYGEQEMKTPVHLYIGQEAVAAGVSQHLKPEDYVFSTHRNHGHYLSKGTDLKPIVAELYGRATGCAKGKGGSMHFVDTDKNCMGTSAIVGGSIPLGAGAALAIKLKKEARLAVTYFGDGASDEGVLQETLNFSALKKLPVLFVCENNFYATNSHQRARHAQGVISKRAPAFGIPCELADGNDVEAVYAAAEKAVAHIRSGNGPYFLEFPTYRWKGHVGPDCDYEKGCRPKEEFLEWAKKCPVDAYVKKLSAAKLLSGGRLAEIKDAINSEITEAWNFAKASPLPTPEDLCSDVYK
ncbi:MAG TPA: thiamine pyrophosphate-dependent dehydrogenase E1 component subunit alpha [Elusimicrobiales bacterium]|nr:thiamine pyrophosphate-dependent dehydrogenase E1 component subunit alpha [Elusimicrobiales bacterium]